MSQRPETCQFLTHLPEEAYAEDIKLGREKLSAKSLSIQIQTDTKPGLSQISHLLAQVDS